MIAMIVLFGCASTLNFKKTNCSEELLRIFNENENNFSVEFEKLYYTLMYDSQKVEKIISCEDMLNEPVPFRWAIKKSKDYKWKAKIGFNKLAGFQFTFSDTNLMAIDSINFFDHDYAVKIYYRLKQSGPVQLIAHSEAEDITLK